MRAGVKKSRRRLHLYTNLYVSIWGSCTHLCRGYDGSVYDIVTCALVAYRANQELASRANHVVFHRCVVELGREEQNYLRERSHWTCRLNTAT